MHAEINGIIQTEVVAKVEEKKRSPTYRYSANRYECPRCGLHWFFACDAYDCIARCDGETVEREPIKASDGRNPNVKG